LAYIREIPSLIDFSPHTIPPAGKCDRGGCGSAETPPGGPSEAADRRISPASLLPFGLI